MIFIEYAITDETIRTNYINRCTIGKFFEIIKAFEDAIKLEFLKTLLKT